MMRRFVCLAGVLCAVSAMCAAQAKDTVYFGLNTSGILVYPTYPSLTLGYERSLTSMLSVAVDVGTEMTIMPYAEIHLRLYPWKQGFFAGIGAGLWGVLLVGNLNPGVMGVMISPEFGWKIDLGKSGAWCIIPSVSGRFIFNGGAVITTKISLPVGYAF